MRSLKREAFTLYLACRDPRTPWYAKAAAGCVVAYAFSPLDLIPDVIPILGLVDDLILLPVGVALALRMIPATVRIECRVQAEEMARRPIPISRAGAAAIVAIWLLLAALSILLLARLLPH